MTKNMGTAAYMAPELTSLVGYVREFCAFDGSGAESQGDKDDLETQERQIQAQHGVGLDKFELSSTPPTPGKLSSAVHTELDLTPKVGTT